MAPRKSSKSPEPAAKKGSPKAAKPRTRKGAAIEAEAAVTEAVAPLVPEVATPIPEPKKPAIKRGRKALAVDEPVVEAPVATPVPSIPPAGLLSPQVEAILLAIQEGRAVEFLFSDAESNPPRTFEPRQLVFDVFTKAWFVWGWDRRYNAERHHRVDLLAAVNPVEGIGRAAQGPFKEGTPGNQIGGWLGGEPIQVKAILFKQWIYAVKQAPAVFPEFKLEDLEEGKALVTFVGTDLRAIARWCMQFGDGIQVMEPQRLVDRIKQVGTAWAGKPVQAPAPPPAKTPEPRHEPRPEPPARRSESPRHEPRESRESREPREPRESRESRENEAPKHRPAKVEIRFERL